MRSIFHAPYPPGRRPSSHGCNNVALKTVRTPEAGENVIIFLGITILLREDVTKVVAGSRRVGYTPKGEQKRADQANTAQACSMQQESARRK